MSSDMNVNQSGRVPHYDAVIKDAKDAVLQLEKASKTVKPLKESTGVAASIKGVFGKRVSTNEQKTVAAPSTNDIHALIDKAKAARGAIKSEIQNLGERRDNPAIDQQKIRVKKLTELNNYITALEAHLPKEGEAKTTSEGARPRAVSRGSINRAASSIIDRAKNALGMSKSEEHKQSPADSMRAGLQSVKGALTPNKGQAKGYYQTDLQNFRDTFDAALSLSNTVDQSDSQELHATLQQAIELEKSLSVDPEKASSKELKQHSNRLLDVQAKLQAAMSTTEERKDLQSQHAAATAKLVEVSKNVSALAAKHKNSSQLQEAKARAMRFISIDAKTPDLKALKNDLQALQKEILALEKLVKEDLEIHYQERTEAKIIDLQWALTSVDTKFNLRAGDFRDTLRQIASKAGTTHENRAAFLEDLDKAITALKQPNIRAQDIPTIMEGLQLRTFKVPNT